MEQTWIEAFLRTKGNEYFVEVDPEFILDRFNLTGLNLEVDNIQQAIDVIVGPASSPCTRAQEELDASARHLYGLIHARYVITSRGLQKTAAKFKDEAFGRCPRALCRGQPMLPVGLSDVPHESSVKLYCPKCEDIYNPKSTRHSDLDGAYWSTSLPGMFVQAYPRLLPRHTDEQFILKVFGFKVHENAQTARWQQRQNRELQQRLAQNGI